MATSTVYTSRIAQYVGGTFHVSGGSTCFCCVGYQSINTNDIFELLIIATCSVYPTVRH